MRDGMGILLATSYKSLYAPPPSSSCSTITMTCYLIHSMMFFIADI